MSSSNDAASKRCTECTETKPLSEFYAHPRMADGYFNRCKACDRARARESMKRLREAPGYTEPEYDRGSEYTRRVRLKSKYGTTPEAVDAMLDDQGGACAICRIDEPGGRGFWNVDHDHDTGRIRGLLCCACNRGIGLLSDDVERLMSAAAYLLAHRDVLSEVTL